MGFCFSKPAQTEPRLPVVIRKASDVKKINLADATSLPWGIRLTGGVRLRQAGLDGSQVRVAVIDSGIDAEHPAFDNMVVNQVWYRAGTPLSQDDHGTHVAGTIHLMAPKAELYDYRVFGRTGRLSVTQAVAQAIRAATDANCHVINMSLGGPASSPAIKAAIEYAASKGVILVAAAGNEGDGDPLTNEISYPAYYDECISVAAVAKRFGFPVAFFSNTNAQVDYAGIGVDVVSMKPGGGFQEMDGTSMASPHVAGLIAALMTNGQLKGDKAVREALTTKYALDIAADGLDQAAGLGFVTYLKGAEFDVFLPRHNKTTK